MIAGGGNLVVVQVAGDLIGLALEGSIHNDGGVLHREFALDQPQQGELDRAQSYTPGMRSSA